MADALTDRGTKLRHLAALTADELRHVAALAASDLTGTASQTAANMVVSSDMWKTILGIVTAIMMVLFGIAYNSLVNSDAEIKKELLSQRQEYQALSNNLSTVTANQSMVLQVIRDSSVKLDTLVQRVYSK